MPSHTGTPDFTVIDQLADEFHQQTHAPGAQFTVVVDGRIAYFAGRGVVECKTGMPASPDCVFRIASLSKSFTAATILQLRDRGLLQLDDPVTKHLPHATGLTDAASPPITMRHCLTMSSGLPTDDPWADRQESLPQQSLDAVLAQPLAVNFRPGTAFAYANLGYAIAGRVVEAATGMSFVDYATEQLLRPLGLTATGYDYRAFPVGRLARGYRRTRDGVWEPQPFTAPGSFSPIGGLLSTVGDLARWMHWLAAGFSPAADDAVLTRSSRREMQQPHRLIPAAKLPADPDQLRQLARRSTAYGYGLVVEATPDCEITSHRGGYPGFGSFLAWHRPTGIGIVALANGTYAPVSTPARAALEALVAQCHSVVPVLDNADLIALAERILGDPQQLRDPIFADNVLRDDPLGERSADITAVCAAAGPITGPAVVENRSPTETLVHLPTTGCGIDVTIALTPTSPPKVHTFGVEKHQPFP